ncbi:glycerate kinase [Aquibacillus koreensis]|uniref:Glycerate kinase n=1 Tax=Aquibacillus koreensis TaxID=279446 RepID=A0A9X3WK87_9BACI|nr:glycerate kinase [Aquibacillus koreensis]MCT2537731.1 glycerate kinase [Aquibacillus koreensis]MDC3421235.1 glycerate kinase [Aquibacillus koreensis]
MRIVVAPDSYKGSLFALKVAEIMGKAIKEVKPSVDVVLKPMADGGEGTIDTMLSSIEGKRIPITCTGPLGEKIDTYYAVTKENIVIVETACIAGLVQVPESLRNPDYTTSFGLGEVIRHALDQGYRSFVIGLGGSAINDGGLGMLRALGMQAFDGDGRELGPYGKDVAQIHSVSFQNLDKRLPQAQLRIACDVDNPLCGKAGASAVFGPQKGLAKERVEHYDKALHNYAVLVEKSIGVVAKDKDGAGAAGGLGFAFLVIGGQLESGAALLAEASGLEDAIKVSDVAITGEGQTDDQTLRGKAPSYVADLARRNYIPTILISGSVNGDIESLNTKFASCFSIINQPYTLEQCLEEAEQLVYQQTKQVTRLIISFCR